MWLARNHIYPPDPYQIYYYWEVLLQNTRKVLLDKGLRVLVELRLQRTVRILTEAKYHDQRVNILVGRHSDTCPPLLTMQVMEVLAC